MKRYDFYLVIGLVLLSLSFFLYNFLKTQSGDYAVIYVGNSEFKKLPLREDITININDKNTVTVKDGKVFMESATCPDKLCVHQEPIDKSGRDIVCLPNRVTIRVVGEKEVDGVVR